jgi:hypothetical protein
MDGAWLARARWRRRGAWLWPAFVALTVGDAFIGHALPPAGETQTLLGAALIALVLNVLAVLLGARPLGALARRARPDLPRVVARDYGGTAAVSAIAVILLAAGLIHRPTVLDHQRAMKDAIARAQAWIGYRAPADFRRNLQFVSTFVIEPGNIYRTCVPSATTWKRTYCVIVKTRLPLSQSVSFAGYESNAQFGAGAG